MLQKNKYEKWPSGDSQTIMSVSLSDSELEQCTGQCLIEGNSDDGLGKWIGLGGDLPSGHPIEFLKHIESPCPTEYVINIDIEANINELAKEIMNHLKITKKNVIWKLDDIEIT